MSIDWKYFFFQFDENLSFVLATYIKTFELRVVYGRSLYANLKGWKLHLKSAERLTNIDDYK